MTAFVRGVQLYLLGLAFVGTLAVVWGTNRFVLGNTTAGTGWPLMVGVAAVLVPLAALERHRRAAADPDDSDDRYPWSAGRR